MRTEKASLTQQLQHDRLSALLAELEREQGPIEPPVLEEVRGEWPAGVEKVAKRRSA